MTEQTIQTELAQVEAAIPKLADLRGVIGFGGEMGHDWIRPSKRALRKV